MDAEQKGQPNISCLAPRLQQQWECSQSSPRRQSYHKQHRQEKSGGCVVRAQMATQKWPARVVYLSKGCSCPQSAARKLCKHNTTVCRTEIVQTQYHAPHCVLRLKHSGMFPSTVAHDAMAGYPDIMAHWQCRQLHFCNRQRGPTTRNACTTSRWIKLVRPSRPA